MSGDGKDDARTLAIRVGDDNVRYSELRESTRLLAPPAFDDWPVRLPRTTHRVCNFIMETAATPLGHHERWKSSRRRPTTDHIVGQHKTWLQTMLVHDHLHMSNLASAELVARQKQLLEDHDKRVCLTTNARGGSCISPKLQEWTASELQKESAVLKRAPRAARRAPVGAQGRAGQQVRIRLTRRQRPFAAGCPRARGP